MANRKEYEMLFALNAQINSGFHGTFTKAQERFVELGNEIRNLQKTQANISAYQKQESAIAATGSKLDNLKQQHVLLQKQIRETKGSTSELERENLKLEQRIKDTEATLSNQKHKLDATTAALEKAQVSTAALEEADASLAAQIADLTAQQEEAARGALTMGEKTAQSFGAIQSAITAAGTAAALKEIGTAYMDCIVTAGDFQESMSTVEALSGAAGNEMEILTAKAKEMGATTKFTAQEASQAMQYMSMAGWDASAMTAGLGGVMQLAAASGEELGTVSDIVTDALTAFGMTAKDTNQFVDILAATATKSNTNVSMLGESFKYAAPLCGTLGYSAQDAAVALGLMANSGIKSSQAGTTLKTALANLSAPTEKQAAVMDDLNISMTNTDGTMKTMMDLTKNLRSAFSGLSESERTAAASTIFGKEAMSGMLAIINASQADFDSLTQSIYGSAGAAQRMAEIKLDNMNGQLTLMKSASDALKTSIGEQFTPAMRELFAVGTDVFTGMDEFVRKSPEAVGAITGVVGAVALLTTGMTAYTAVTKAAKALDLAAMFTGPGAIILGVGAAVAGLGGAIYGMYQKAHEGVPEVEELTRAASDLGETAEQAGHALSGVTSDTQASIDVAGTYIARLKEIEAATKGNVTGNEDYHNTLTLLSQVMPDLAGQIDLATNSIEGGTAALEESIAAAQKNAEEQAKADKMAELLSKQAAAEQELAKNKLDRTAAEIRLTEIEKERAEVRQRLTQLSAQGLDMSSPEQLALVKQVNELDLEYTRTENTIKNYNAAIEEGEAAALSAKDAIGDYNAALAEQSGVSQETAQQISALENVIGGTVSQVESLVAAYGEAYSAAHESISGQYALWDQAAQVAAVSAGSVNTSMESQIAYWEAYNQNLESLRDRASDIEGLGSVIASFADGSANSVNMIAGMVSANDADLKAMVQNWEELQKAQDDAAQSVADLKTDFSSQMDELQQALAEDIAAMDLSSEALESGQATIQGFINAAEDMLPEVQRAYNRLGVAAASALSSVGGGSVSLDLLGSPTPHYASGTDSAEPGFALVGEEGPELVYFNGGEKVINASETASMRTSPGISAMVTPYGGGDSPVTIQLSINIQGNATPETVEALQAQGEDMAQKIREILMDMMDDRKRRAMA